VTEIPLNPPASAEAATRRQAFFKGGNWIPAFAGMTVETGVVGQKYPKLRSLLIRAGWVGKTRRALTEWGVGKRAQKEF
jgi:hypothetical protein